MPIFDIILLVIGIALLFLGGFSGYSILTRSLRVSDKFGDETNIGSLWALFLIGISVGLFFIWLGLPS